MGELIEVVRPPSLVQAVADTLKKKIFSGEFPEGSPLPEVQLSEALRVSRGTVREALRKLKEENIVVVYPHRGAFVPELTEQQLNELYSIRALIESYAVRIAMEKGSLTNELLAHLGDLVQTMAEAERDGEDTVNMEADFEFHITLCKASHHDLLINFMESLRSLTYRAVHSMIISESEPTDSGSQHKEILQAIESGDIAKAISTVEKHLVDSRSWLLARWRELKQKG